MGLVNHNSFTQMHHLVGWTYHEHYGVTQRSCFFRRRDRNCILVTANPQPSQHEFVWKWDTPKIQLFIINSSIKLAILWVVYGGILVYIPFSDTHTHQHLTTSASSLGRIGWPPGLILAWHFLRLRQNWKQEWSLIWLWVKTLVPGWYPKIAA